MKSNTRLRSTLFRLMAVCVLACLMCFPALAADGETLYNSEYCFRETDFDADVISNLTGIFVTEVPDAAVAAIRLGARTICVGDVLPVEVLDQLTLSPACTDNCDAILTYLPIRDASLDKSTQLTIRIKSGKNETPKALDAEFETYKNIANDGTLTGTDPEDSALTFQLVDKPKRGTVELNADGTYVYTPNNNKVGEDKFTFTVTDDAGNVSAPATVKIMIMKPSDSKTFTDMNGSNDQFEAMWTQSTGLSSGRTIAGTLCYQPEETITRSEFLVMAMKLAGIEIDDEMTVSGFADANDAPAWVQPYLSAAMRYGISSGIVTQSGLMFYPNEPITGEQAAVMLQNILDLPISAAATELDAPAWAQSSMQALAEAGIHFTNAAEPMSRIGAAKLLYQASKLFD